MMPYAEQLSKAGAAEAEIKKAELRKAALRRQQAEAKGKAVQLVVDEWNAIVTAVANLNLTSSALEGYA